jgi:uncharacterized membrane protein YgdD (TMEM256/DUF423 family)
MIGKKNVVFGFIYLVFTAALGPYMVVSQVPEINKAKSEKQSTVGRLQQLKLNDYEEELEPLSGEQIAKANTSGILGLNKVYNAEDPKNAIRGGPHAHGNLEALLNIVVGIALGFIAVGAIFKQIISWVFIIGTIMHSGMLYLVVFLQQAWAVPLMELPIGPVFILLGLLLAGVAAIIGFRGELVKDG